jgi:hypothetical protein
MLDHSVPATSPVVLTNEQEVNSKSEAGFIPVVSKASKRRARKAAATATAKEKARASKVCTMCERRHPVLWLLETFRSLQVSRLRDVKLTQALVVQH